jgi:hypothetical protein
MSSHTTVFTEHKDNCMSKIKIEKFVKGELKNSFSVPELVLKLIAQLLPEQAVGDLAHRGVDIKAILEAQKLGAPYSASVEVTEGGVQKTVVISVE